MIDTVGVPSGIGDVSWIYSKLMHVGRLRYEIADGWPYRTVPFLELLPRVSSAAYGKFNYQDIIAVEQCNYGSNPRWGDINANGFERVLIEANRHLEMGRPLAEWLPDLPTEYHYPIITKEEDNLRAVQLLKNLEPPLWGISAASYRGSEAWKTWGHPEWSTFLKQLKAEAGGSIVLLGGFWDDLTATLADEGYYDIVGKTSVGTAVEVLRLLDGYIGFSSGLGVIHTVFNKPTFMLWPDHQVELSTSWADPEMIANQRYMTSLWREPDLVFKRTKQWLKANFI